MTGGASGIGSGVKKQIIQNGFKVVDVDVRDADIVADLSTDKGRQAAISGIRSAMPDGLDGFIPCAGLGAHVENAQKIMKVNFFGVITVIEGIMDLLEKKDGNIVIISSNSAPMPNENQKLVDAMLKGDEKDAESVAEHLDGFTAYCSSKLAVTRWMRRNAPVFIKRGVRMNAVAPGITQSAMTDEAFEAPSTAEAMKEFAESVPVGFIAKPAHIAHAILFLLGEKAEFICGSVLFVDGGHDALLRPDSF
jgi:NAD(P)-dependent dehydrogenase (short-subunit alcohol dehydrogenase family)